MVGCRTGVTTQLKAKNPYILSIHCIAHRLALASGQAADAVPYVKQYQLYVNSIYRYFHYSTKHAAKLKEIQSVLNENFIKCFTLDGCRLKVLWMLL